MSTRYLSNLALILGAAFLVVATMAFVPGSVAWITFGVAIGTTLTGALVLGYHRTLGQQIVFGLATAVGIWLIVASLVYFPTTVVWLGFASAIALVGLGAAGLTVHELTTERVVHSLEVPAARSAEELSEPQAADREPIAA